MEIPQKHIDRIHAILTEKGPVAASFLIYDLTDRFRIEGAIPMAVMAALNCPGTWRVDLSDDTALVGLESQDKPGDGSVEAVAEFMGLAWLDCGDRGGCYVPAQISGNDQGDGRRDGGPTSPPTSSPFHPPSC